MELGICPLERAEVLLREEDGAGDPKANVLEVFCNRIPQKIKSITESNKALKVFN